MDLLLDLEMLLFVHVWMKQQEENHQQDMSDKSIVDTSEPVIEGTVSAEALEASDREKATPEISWDLCEFKTDPDPAIKIHKVRKHRHIPELDGESATVRHTDDWWEKKNLKHRTLARLQWA